MENNFQSAVSNKGVSPDRHACREAMSDLSRDHAELERIALSLRQRLALAFTRYQSAARSVEDYRDGTLPMGRQAYELQIASYRGRRTPWTQVLASRRMYFDLSKETIWNRCSSSGEPRSKSAGCSWSTVCRHRHLPPRRATSKRWPRRARVRSAEFLTRSVGGAGPREPRDKYLEASCLLKYVTVVRARRACPVFPKCQLR